MSRPKSQLRYGNRIIQQIQDNNALIKHYESLKKTRPTTSHICQRDTMITINNKKKQLNNENRFTEIQRQNRLLFSKITTIMNKGSILRMTPTKDLSFSKINKTLNGSFRRKQLQNIEFENAKLLKRLKQKKSSYQTNSFHRDWMKKKQVIKNMALYPFILNDNIGLRKDSVNNNYFTLNQNKQRNETFQIKRVRKIDNILFLITVKFQGPKLYIIGDTKEEQNIKIIQLQRKQAQQFINDQCQGNIQKIFDMLKYDRNGGDLYLIGKDVNNIDQIKKIQKNRNNFQRKRVTTSYMPHRPIKTLSKQLIKQYSIQNNQQEQQNKISQVKSKILINDKLSTLNKLKSNQKDQQNQFQKKKQWVQVKKKQTQQNNQYDEIENHVINYQNQEDQIILNS